MLPTPKVRHVAPATGVHTHVPFIIKAAGFPGTFHQCLLMMDWYYELLDMTQIGIHLRYFAFSKCAADGASTLYILYSYLLLTSALQE